ncbi:MAG: O-antigen ligase family protein [Verrucomicrobiota bacterium]
MSHLILLTCLAATFWFVRRDIATRPGVSSAIWIPTLWVGILASRPISLWLGLGGGNTLEGSPLDRLFFFGMIVAAAIVLARRGFTWGPFLARNWPLVLFYGYLLLTVAWANSPLASSKRWLKEIGNVLVVIVILTERDPLQAIRAVFVRCAYVLIPLSFVYIRYFPDLGRRYSTHSGQLEITGVTTQKNSLGAMILVCALVFIWDWLERSRPGGLKLPRLDRYVSFVILGFALYLLYQSDSKTSMLCLAVAAGLIAAVRLPVLHRRISAMGIFCLIGGLGFALFDWMFGLSEAVVSNLGRDMTFTGRTDVWRELLAVNTDPIFGAGFMSFWDDIYYQSKLPDWVAFSAHNGYLEIYLAGGIVGVVVLALMLLGSGARINRALASGEPYALVRFAVFVVALIANFSESNFACMTPIGFLFLIAAIGQAQPETVPAFAEAPTSYPTSYYDQATPYRS